MISFPPTPESKHKIDAIVENINGSNFGIKNYKTTQEKIVAYLFFLIKGHPFIDGNKRTAVLSFLVLCEINNLEKHLKGYDLDALAVFLEQISGTNHQQIIKMLAGKIFTE